MHHDNEQMFYIYVQEIQHERIILGAEHINMILLHQLIQIIMHMIMYGIISEQRLL